MSDLNDPEVLKAALSAALDRERTLRRALESIQGECYLWQQADSPFSGPADLIEFLRRESRSALESTEET